MSKPLPNFDKMLKSYPADPDSGKVKKEIGGKVDAGWIGNTCAIRLSKAFNYADAPIPKSHSELNVVSGADGKWYAYRVREFRKFLESVYGAPAIVKKKTSSGLITKNDFNGKRGIICFEVKGWNDATGHLTLWNGMSCVYGDYFDKAYEVALWTE